MANFPAFDLKLEILTGDKASLGVLAHATEFRATITLPSGFRYGVAEIVDNATVDMASVANTLRRLAQSIDECHADAIHKGRA